MNLCVDVVASPTKDSKAMELFQRGLEYNECMTFSIKVCTGWD